MTGPIPATVARQLSRLLAGLPDDADATPEGWQWLTEPVASANGAGRLRALDEALAGRDDADSIRAQVINADPSSEPQGIFATWADAKRVIGPVKWAWRQWLAQGMLSIVASEAGVGKSSLLLYLVGCFLKGWPWPDGTPFTGETGKVLWVEAEAAQMMNTERAEKWGLPLEQIITPFADPLTDAELNNPEHRIAIANIASQEEIRFTVIDSLSGGDSRDDNKSEIRGTVKWLAELARDTQKPFALSHHLRKRGLIDTGDSITLDRVRGSSTIVQQARIVWALDAPDPNQPDAKRLSMIKNNLARFADPLGLTISEDGVTFGNAPTPPKQETLEERAADLLLALLRKAPTPATQLQEEIEGAGLSWYAAKRASAKLGIVKRKTSRGWVWSLPIL